MIHLFKCSKCKYEYDEYIPVERPIISKCPKCKSKSKKVFGFCGVIKGEEWPQKNVQASPEVVFRNRHEEDKYFESIKAVRV